jgi:predicted transcriptional regulator of viral defense system
VNAEPEKALYEIAEDQGGYFSLSQAESVGIRRNQIYRDVERSKIERVYPGVYRLALFPANQYEEIYAAVVSIGEEAIVCFETALYVYGLSDIIPSEIHIIVPRSSSRRRTHIKMHTNQLDDQDITSFEGFRITTVARTLVDVLATHVSLDQVELAITQAISRGLTTPDELLIQAKKRSQRISNQMELLLKDKV